MGLDVAQESAAHAMDRIYRYQRHIYDLTRRYYLLGREKLIDELDVPKGGTILEAGCGTGRNLVLAARRYPEAQLYGFDISSAMLETAANSLVAKGLTSRIRLAEADATQFDPQHSFNREGFDRVFVSYALSMIPDWERALEQAWGSVKPGGSLHIADFGQQDELPAWFRSGLRAWLSRFSVHPRDRLGDALERIASRDGAALNYESLYRGYASYAIVNKT